MRISDWSSEVGYSVLAAVPGLRHQRRAPRAAGGIGDWGLGIRKSDSRLRLRIPNHESRIPPSEQHDIELLLEVLLVGLEADRLAEEFLQLRQARKSTRLNYSH